MPNEEFVCVTIWNNLGMEVKLIPLSITLQLGVQSVREVSEVSVSFPIIWFRSIRNLKR